MGPARRASPSHWRSPHPAQAAGDAERGKQIGYTCLGCHGIENYKNVYPTYSVPKLVGQHAEYIVAALKEYRGKQRSHGTMYAQASSLSDQDMEDVAAYLAGAVLPAGAPPNGTPPQKVTELCSACHGANGVGITGDYPTLAGQHADYLARALVEYQQRRSQESDHGSVRRAAVRGRHQAHRRVLRARSALR